MGSIKSRIIDYLLYILIGSAVSGILVFVFFVTDAPRSPEEEIQYKNWLGTGIYVPIFWGCLIEIFRDKLRSLSFWFTLVLWSACHVLIFWLIFNRVGAWRPGWYAVSFPIEVTVVWVLYARLTEGRKGTDEST